MEGDADAQAREEIAKRNAQERSRRLALRDALHSGCVRHVCARRTPPGTPYAEPLDYVYTSGLEIWTDDAHFIVGGHEVDGDIAILSFPLEPSRLPPADAPEVHFFLRDGDAPVVDFRYGVDEETGLIDAFRLTLPDGQLIVAFCGEIDVDDRDEWHIRRGDEILLLFTSEEDAEGHGLRFVESEP